MLLSYIPFSDVIRQDRSPSQMQSWIIPNQAQRI